MISLFYKLIEQDERSRARRRADTNALNGVAMADGRAWMIDWLTRRQ